MFKENFDKALACVNRKRLMLAVLVVLCTAAFCVQVIATKEVATAKEREGLRFSEINSVHDFLEWITVEFNPLNRGELSGGDINSSDVAVQPEIPSPIIKDEPNINTPLDLSLPQNDVFDTEIDAQLYEINSSIMPDLFAKADKPSSSRKVETTSFGGRLLMDQGFEELERYHFQDIKNAIQGAELTFEVRTN